MPATQMLVTANAYTNKVWVFDGATFTAVTLSGSGTFLSCATNGAGTYVVVADDGNQVYTSTNDCTSFTAYTLPETSYYGWRVVWDAALGKFLATCEDRQRIFGSLDGVVWSASPVGFSNTYFMEGQLIRWGPELYVKDPSYGRLMVRYSNGAMAQQLGEDGITVVATGVPTLVPNPTNYSQPPTRLIGSSSGGQYALNPNGNAVFRASRTQNFTTSGTAGLFSAVWTGSYLIGGIEDGWAYSEDGSTWDTYTPAAMSGWYPMDAYYDGTYVWFACADSAGGTTASLFRITLTDPAAGTVTATEFALGSPVDAFWSICGYPLVPTPDYSVTAADTGSTTDEDEDFHLNDEFTAADTGTGTDDPVLHLAQSAAETPTGTDAAILSVYNYATDRGAARENVSKRNLNPAVAEHPRASDSAHVTRKTSSGAIIWDERAPYDATTKLATDDQARTSDNPDWEV